MTSFPGGYCSALCGSSGDGLCGAEGLCLIGATFDMCVSLCTTPGSRSNCRVGYSCLPLKNRNDGFCFPESTNSGSGGGGGSSPPPPPKKPTGASCSADSQCSTNGCALNGWPGGYCTRTCTTGDVCGTGGVCLETSDGDTFCVAQCPNPGSQSTCRSGYGCYPFASPRTDGYCAPLPQNAGAGGGGGAGGGSGGGTGGGSGGGGGAALPTIINYKVIGMQGTYSGNATHVESTTRTDTLAMNTCTYNSPGTTASQPAYIGLNGFTPSLNVYGPTTCPAATATSTATSSCTSQPINVNGTLEWKVEMSGWTDASVVTFKIRYPPVGMPACNHATVIMNANNEWGIVGTTTVGKFRGGVAFPVRFVGARALNVSSPWVKTSDVSWDFTMTIQPL